jgi:hypothetical protein
VSGDEEDLGDSVKALLWVAYTPEKRGRKLSMPFWAWPGATDICYLRNFKLPPLPQIHSLSPHPLISAPLLPVSIAHAAFRDY